MNGWTTIFGLRVKLDSRRKLICARGDQLLDVMRDGQDAEFNTLFAQLGDLRAAICARLETDYAIWIAAQN